MAEYQVVRYKAGKITFELLTKPGNALKFKEGKVVWDNVTFSDEVSANYFI
jgi:ribosome maturation protein Sdo1